MEKLAEDDALRDEAVVVELENEEDRRTVERRVVVMMAGEITSTTVLSVVVRETFQIVARPVII